eukprot:350500-Chlamydomonas_euryale.AAC.11
MANERRQHLLPSMFGNVQVARSDEIQAMLSTCSNHGRCVRTFSDAILSDNAWSEGLLSSRKTGQQVSTVDKPLHVMNLDCGISVVSHTGSCYQMYYRIQAL